jgi:MoxR-like ATPase
MSLMDDLARARSRAIPLVAVRTADQPAALAAIAGIGSPVVSCDPVMGVRSANEAGKAAMAAMLGDLDPSMAADPVTALTLAASAPEDVIVVMLAGDRALAEPRPAVAALLLRDRYAATGRTLVVLGAGWTPAAELGSDVYVIDDSLPDEGERRASVTSLVEGASLPLVPSEIDAAVQYTRGLSRFAVDQTVALALNGRGLRLDVLARVWREAIDRTPGLRVEASGEGSSLEAIAGLEALKNHARRLTGGRARPDVVVWVDELEKVVAGASGAVADSSGASQAVLGAILTAMERSSAEGLIMVGPPGTGKSLSATTIGAAAGVPTIQLQPGRLKGSLVGQTEEQAERAMRVLQAMGGRAYWVATSNGLGTVPPELLRRFTDGVWMVDLPDAAERAALWAMYAARFELACDLPSGGMDAGYAGADVRNVCRTAWRDGVTVAEVMASYVPASRANVAGIDALRRQAVNAYRSASYAGAYQPPPSESAAPVKGRKMALGGS